MQAHISIDPSALEQNIVLLKAHFGQVAFLAVLKANAYGHGLSLVAPTIQPFVDAYGVYTIAEAQQLRSLGIHQPIHIIGSVPTADIPQAIKLDAILPLWNSSSWQNDLRTAASRMQKRAQVQIKIDTGLTRLGISANETARMLAELHTQNALKLVGGYTHLAAAEELDSRYTLDQLECFLGALPAGTVPQRHLAASAAAMAKGNQRSGGRAT